MFTALMSEAGKLGNTEILPPKVAAILDKWQKKSYSTGREYSFTSSINENPFVRITSQTKFITTYADWINTSLYLYGEIFEEGGLSKSNLHILTDRYGKLTVNASKDQLTSGSNKLYNIYGLWVNGKQNLLTGELKDLTLIDFLIYKQNYDEISLNALINKASLNWSKIKDKDSWLSDIKGGEHE